MSAPKSPSVLPASPLAASVSEGGWQRAPESPRPLRWVRDLFRRRLRLERRGVQIHVLLDPAPPAPPAAEPTAPRRSETLRRAQRELGQLLDRHADTRHVVPHLSFVEQTLASAGLRGIGRLPLPVLHKALNQLDSLIHDEPGAGLAEVRRRMVAVISLRLGGTPAVNLRSDLDGEDRLEVSEASHSQFDELERSWTGTVPGELTALVAGSRG